MHLQVIKKHKNAHQQYVDRLISEGTVTPEEVRVIHNRVQHMLQSEFDAAKDYKPKPREWLASMWAGFMSPAQKSRIRNTGVSMDMLQSVGHVITKIPKDFTPHRQIEKVFTQRRQMVSDETALVDWAMAEALAFGTLVAEGNHVRLSGQVSSQPRIHYAGYVIYLTWLVSCFCHVNAVCS